MIETITGILQSESIANLFYLLVSTLATYIVLRIKKKMDQEAINSSAFDVVVQAVAVVYREYVADIKKAREDGKLTLEEREEARAKAKQKALELACSDEMREFLGSIGSAAFDVLIEKAVNHLKK